jgi:hypothetical protein
MEKTLDSGARASDWAALASDPKVVKILGTIDRDGRPRLSVKSSIRAGEGGLMEVWEMIETSRSNKNLLSALWFGGAAAVLLAPPDGRSFLLRVRPVRTIICGREFQERYEEAKKLDPRSPLSAVWLLAVDEVEETTLSKRRLEEEAAHPLAIHLDRLLV